MSAPVLLYQVDPEFSEEARRAKTAGNVLVNLWVDEKAATAVKLYKFKPAMENGKPVMVEMNVEVTFHIF